MDSMPSNSEMVMLRPIPSSPPSATMRIAPCRAWAGSGLCGVLSGVRFWSSDPTFVSAEPGPLLPEVGCFVANTPCWGRYPRTAIVLAGQHYFVPVLSVRGQGNDDGGGRRSGAGTLVLAVTCTIALAEILIFIGVGLRHHLAADLQPE